MQIRLARSQDLPAINDIYNHYVLASTCTYQLEPETMEDRLAWFSRHGDKHPVTVAEEGGKILGWGSLSRYHPRAAYDRTVEDSVYVHPELQRRGIGSALLGDLIERAQAAGHHTIIAAIDAEQAASVALHARWGFEKVGHMRDLGWKFERWLDVIYLQRMI